MFKAIEWSEFLAPNPSCRYSHVIGKTPFGDFLITWKSWDDIPRYEVEESPCEQSIGKEEFCLIDAKHICEDEYNKCLRSCLETNGEQNV